MKELCALAALGAILLIAGLCLNGEIITERMLSGYHGSRLGNDSELAMDYTAFNGADSQTLTLVAGDVLHVDIVSEKGSVGLAIQKDGGETLYEGTELPTNSFDLAIDDAGGYTVSVTGRHARGSIHVVRVPGEASE